jgi:hypothetical protein
VAHDNPNAMDANNLIDIRARLEQDAHGEAARELIAQFKAAAEPLEELMQGTLPADEYKNAEAMQLALAAAQEVVQKVWETLHEGKSLSL